MVLGTAALVLWAARLGYFLFTRALRSGEDRRLKK
jgi:steroid 5-alpha reductase family enzyme